MTSREAYIALNMIDEVGPVRVRALLDVLGTPAAILAASPGDLQRVSGVGGEVARQISRWQEQIDLAAELERIAAADVRVVTREDPDYPRNLGEIYDPPLVLYVRGTLAETGDAHAVAIVGSRRATHYGQDMARKLAYQLAHAGITVVSGGARGVDTAAHTGALQAKGRTVVVLGCGLDTVYPAENGKLFDQVVDRGGAVVTEFPLGVKPDRQHFPMRNRIISGWSLGVVVVEAHLQSGALITARQAGDQGRQVFAVPGRADSPLAHGCHRLIKDGAKLTEDVEDVLSEFEYLFPPSGPARSPEASGAEGALPLPPLNELESKIMAVLGAEETGIDEVIRASGLTSAAVSATLVGLEMRRLVKQLPGKMFVRNVLRTE
ncbi:DNA-protecting protein DprA [bacterium]|nr:DNA-protecting protein DprA [bacterium]